MKRERKDWLDAGKGQETILWAAHIATAWAALQVGCLRWLRAYARQADRTRVRHLRIPALSRRQSFISESNQNSQKSKLLRTRTEGQHRPSVGKTQPCKPCALAAHSPPHRSARKCARLHSTLSVSVQRCVDEHKAVRRRALCCRQKPLSSIPVTSHIGLALP